MSDLLASPPSPAPHSKGPSTGHSHGNRSDDQRALRILAKSVYRELCATGYDRSEIVGFTNELLDLLTSDCRAESHPDA